jgi:ribonuclease P protein component
MSFAYPRRLRLLKPQEFRAVFQQAKRLHNHGISLLRVPNNVGLPRLGLVLAKREVGKAVNRNRFKRLIRESFRLHQHQLADYDMIVMLKRQCRDMPNVEFCECLEKLWLKA